MYPALFLHELMRHNIDIKSKDQTASSRLKDLGIVEDGFVEGFGFGAIFEDFLLSGEMSAGVDEKVFGRHLFQTQLVEGLGL